MLQYLWLWLWLMLQYLWLWLPYLRFRLQRLWLPLWHPLLLCRCVCTALPPFALEAQLRQEVVHPTAEALPTTSAVL